MQNSRSLKEAFDSYHLLSACCWKKFISLLSCQGNNSFVRGVSWFFFLSGLSHQKQVLTWLICLILDYFETWNSSCHQIPQNPTSGINFAKIQATQPPSNKCGLQDSLQWLQLELHWRNRQMSTDAKKSNVKYCNNGSNVANHAWMNDHQTKKIKKCESYWQRRLLRAKNSRVMAHCHDNWGG